MSTLKAIAPWFGSKRILGPRIVEALGQHHCYWEPFCGSMAVLLAKPLTRMENVCDRHRDLINLAWVLREDKLAKELYDRVGRLLYHEELFREAASKIAGGSFEGTAADVDRAVDYFVVSWMGRGGSAGLVHRPKGQFAGVYTNKGGHGGTRWLSACSSIPWWHERLRGVVILCRDAFEVLARIDDAAGTSIYCDPPYWGVRSSRDGYEHEFAEEDHVRLAGLLARFRLARVVVSYYPHERLGELYPAERWCRTAIEGPQYMAAMGSRDGGNETRAVELLLINDPHGGGLFSMKE